MRVERRVLGRRGQHLVALPAAIRKHLDTVPGGAVYFHITAAGVVALTVTGQVKGGKPRAGADCPSCAARERELIRVRAREGARDRTLYAQGYSDGRMFEQERLTRPTGAPAMRHHRLRLAAIHLPDDAATTRRRQQREAKRQRTRTAAGLDVVPAPVLGAALTDASPAPDSPSPSAVIERGADTSGQPPQVSHYNAPGAGTVPGTA